MGWLVSDIQEYKTENDVYNKWYEVSDSLPIKFLIVMNLFLAEHFQQRQKL